MLELASLMARQARYRPDATAVVFENERLTYRQFWVRVARVGNMLRALGVGPGDKVATVAGNSASLLETYWAVPTIGATLVPLSPLLLATGLASLLHDSDARCLVTQASMLPVLREMRAELPPHVLLMTAAGTIQPAKVVIMGAGVAGLQAIATARRLGALVEVSDIRPEVKEQVASLGARFIDLPTQESGSGEGGYAKEVSADFLQKQQAVIGGEDRRGRRRDHHRAGARHARAAPGHGRHGQGHAPGLGDRRPRRRLGRQLRADRERQRSRKHGVLILGYSDLPTTMPEDASYLFARNVVALLALVLSKEGLKLDLADEIIAGTLLTHAGEVRTPAPPNSSADLKTRGAFQRDAATKHRGAQPAARSDPSGGWAPTSFARRRREWRVAFRY